MKQYKHKNEDYLESIFNDLFDQNLILLDIEKGWTLHSGLWSPIYIQLRKLISLPTLLDKISEALKDLFEKEILIEENKPASHYSFLGLAMAGIPIATALSLKTNRPALMTRKIQGSIENFEQLIHEYGSHSLIEGIFQENQSLILVDDLMTSFQSKKNALELVKFELTKKNIPLSSFPIKHIIIIIDREQTDLGKIETEYNIKVHSLIKMRSQGLNWIRNRLNSSVSLFLEKYFENPNIKPK